MPLAGAGDSDAGFTAERSIDRDAEDGATASGSIGIIACITSEGATPRSGVWSGRVRTTMIRTIAQLMCTLIEVP
jgi:hypothetical protein